MSSMKNCQIFFAPSPQPQVQWQLHVINLEYLRSLNAARVKFLNSRSSMRIRYLDIYIFQVLVLSSQNQYRLVGDLEVPDVSFFWRLLLCLIPLLARCEAVKHGELPSTSPSGLFCLFSVCLFLCLLWGGRGSERFLMRFACLLVSQFIFQSIWHICYVTRLGNITSPKGLY